MTGEEKAKKRYLVRLRIFTGELDIPREKFEGYKEDAYLVEGIIVAGIRDLKDRLKRCNRAYKKVNREVQMLRQVDLRDLLEVQREKQ